MSCRVLQQLLNLYASSVSSRAANLCDLQRAHKIDLNVFAELVYGLIHQGPIECSACIVYQAVQGVAIEHLSDLQQLAPAISCPFHVREGIVHKRAVVVIECQEKMLSTDQSDVKMTCR